jgi:hypothetical protein
MFGCGKHFQTSCLEVWLRTFIEATHTLSKTTFSITTFGMTTLSIMALSIMTFSMTINQRQRRNTFFNLEAQGGVKQQILAIPKKSIQYG